MNKSKAIIKPQPAEAREAVRTLIRWAGDDPDRPGMQDTPERLLRFYEEFFSGYRSRPGDFAGSIANDVACEEFVLITDIEIASFCEHHLLPATGVAHIAYIPGTGVPGIGAVARIADACARRFTTQEALTADTAAMMESAFAPAGVAVMTAMAHGCMNLRAPERNRQATVTTAKFTGAFLENSGLQDRFFMLIAAGRGKNT